MTEARLVRIEKKIDTMQLQVDEIRTKVIRLETVEQVTNEQNKLKRQTRTQWIAISLTLFLVALDAIKIWIIR